MRSIHRLLAISGLVFVAILNGWAQCDFGKEADSYVQPLVKSGKAYAAVVAYVHGGAPPELRTYGEGISTATLWRAASVSKALTALAVVQLAEQGKLPLDADIRGFVPSSAIHNRYNIPATVRQLLLHQSGIDDHFIGDGFTDGQQPSVTEIVAANPLDVVYEPGRVESYSNYGYALLGAAIEKASGERYEKYMEEHLLRPIGMANSTFQQPLPADWLSRMAPGKWVYQHAAPAASLTTTVEDMARFLSATLDGVKPIVSSTNFDQMVPLAARGVRLMHGLGYWTGMDKGQRLIAASGDIEDFHNLLIALPEAHSGFAIMISGPSTSLAWNFYSRFKTACIPSAKDGPSAPSANTTTQGSADNRQVAGLYRTTRYPHSELSKAFILFDLTRVAAGAGGTINIGGQQCRPLRRDEYECSTGGPSVSFIRTADRKQFLVQAGSTTLERIHWWETGIAAVMCYFGCIALFIVGWVKARRLSRILYGILLAYAVGWLGVVFIIGPSNLILGLPISLRFFLAIGTSLPVIFIASGIAAIRRTSRLGLLLPLSLLPFSGLVWYWHLYWP